MAEDARAPLGSDVVLGLGDLERLARAQPRPPLGPHRSDVGPRDARGGCWERGLSEYAVDCELNLSRRVLGPQLGEQLDGRARRFRWRRASAQLRLDLHRAVVLGVVPHVHDHDVGDALDHADVQATRLHLQRRRRDRLELDVGGFRCGVHRAAKTVALKKGEGRRDGGRSTGESKPAGTGSLKKPSHAAAACPQAACTYRLRPYFSAPPPRPSQHPGLPHPI